MPGAPQQINILMVDDNPTNLLALETVLQAPDRNLVRASSGDEALRYLLEGDVAVILLDVFMPGIDGLETAALIRGRDKSRDIPIIFVTADISGGAYASKGYSLGAVDYILKPIDPDILRSKVAVFVELYKKTEEIKRQTVLLHEKNIELENANLQRLSMLIELGQQLAAEREPISVLEKFCHAARHIVGASYSVAGMSDRDGQALRHLLISPVETKANLFNETLDAGRGILRKLLREGQPLRLPDLGTLGDPAHPLAELPFLGAPIITSGESIGWLYLIGKEDADEFSEADERLAVTLTSQAAVAYENARLYTEAKINAAELAQEIAERKQAEEERALLLVREQAARAEAEKANRTKDEFLATLSHELRTPLTSILGWTRLLRQGNFDEVAINRALETIERNAKSQSQLIDDLLDVSRIITGKLRLDVQAINVVGVIEAAVESVRPAAQAKSIELVTELDETLGYTTGDSNRLQQIFWNLFSNAVKFTPERGRVEVQLEKRSGQLEIAVRDTGQGISSDFLPFIFDRFRQADGSTTRIHGGLGLGLAIVRHLVELHGGTIRAASDGPGSGSVFTVALPLAETTKGAVAEALTNLSMADSGLLLPEANWALLGGMKIFVVDDEEDTRDLIAAVLSESGAEVKLFNSAPAVLAALSEQAPDLLVSDIGLPGEDGYSLIRKVRESDNAQLKKLPALALTAYAGVEHRARALAAGFQNHMAKPLYPEKLLEVVLSLLKEEKLEERR
ncbi:MAG: response regulator [Pyrinomonadaceae bacterium]